MISFVAMPTLAVTRELLGKFSCPSLTNVYYFEENFSLFTSANNNKEIVKKKDPASNFPFPSSRFKVFV